MKSRERLATPSRQHSTMLDICRAMYNEKSRAFGRGLIMKTKLEFGSRRTLVAVSVESVNACAARNFFSRDIDFLILLDWNSI